MSERLKTSDAVIVETYPTEAYHQLGLRMGTAGAAKTRQEDRRADARRLLDWCAQSAVSPDEELLAQLLDGFGSGKSGEDRFDALVGLFGMIDTIRGGSSQSFPATPKSDFLRGGCSGSTPCVRHQSARPICRLGPEFRAERAFARFAAGPATARMRSRAPRVKRRNCPPNTSPTISTPSATSASVTMAAPTARGQPRRPRRSTTTPATALITRGDKRLVDAGDPPTEPNRADEDQEQPNDKPGADRPAGTSAAAKSSWR